MASDYDWKAWADGLTQDEAVSWLWVSSRAPQHPRRIAASCHVLGHPEHERLRRYCVLCEEATDA